MPSKINSDKIEEVFGKDDPLIIVFTRDDVLNDTCLKRIRDLSREFSRMENFDMVMSLFEAKNIKGENGAMLVQPAVRRIPKTEERKDKLRKELAGNDLVYNSLVSEDFKNTLIILRHSGQIGDTQLIDLVQEKLNAYPGKEEVMIFGQPYLRAETSKKIARDLLLLLPIGLLIMFFFLWLALRELSAVLLPFSIVILSIIIAMSLIPLFGWEISIIGILVPIMMLAIANNYGIHVVSRYQELRMEYPNSPRNRRITELVLFLRNPVIMTGITTIVGIGGLIAHIMIPAKQMGVVTALGIGFALLLSLSFIPATLSLFKEKKNHRKDSGNVISGMLRYSAHLVTSHPKRVVGVFAVFLLIALAALPRLKVAADFNNVMPAKHPFNQALTIVNKDFGGTKYINLMFGGDVKDPVLLKKMDSLKSDLEAMPEIGNINSIATIIRMISRALLDPQDPFYDRIPDSREAVAQYLELYGFSGDPEDFEEFVDFEYTHALMTIQYQAGDIKTVQKVVDRIKGLLLHYELDPVIGGYSLVEKELSHAVTIGQKNSLIFAFLAICILLMIIFRSFLAGLLGSLPLLFAVLCTFGMMSWTGIELNIVTALLSSISIGLGVDYTIHIFWRLKNELKKSGSYQNAVRESITKTGRGITINALSVVAGFSVLFISSFPLIRSFAFLIISSILFCLLCALFLIPALCIIIKPYFLNRKTKSYEYASKNISSRGVRVGLQSEAG
jgi:predicted RND superfamily exporter protein